MKLGVKVWPLPTLLSEEGLHDLFIRILNGAATCHRLGVKSEKDILVGFPTDMMKFGTGEDLMIELLLPWNLPDEDVESASKIIGEQVKEFFRRSEWPEIRIFISRSFGSMSPVA